jgi:hypothetical protein
MGPAQQAIEKLVRDAERWVGWRVAKTKRGWVLYPANKSFGPITLHKTPSDHRAWKNTLARLRRAGAPV